MVDDVHRFSDILAGLADRPNPKVTVADVLEAFGDRAFGAVLAVFAAPLALPMPPGVSAILGAPSFKYFNVAIAAAGKAVEATTDHLADAQARDTCVVRSLSVKEMAALGLSPGDVAPA